MKNWKEANLKSNVRDDGPQVHIRIQLNYSYFLRYKILMKQGLPGRVIARDDITV